MAPFPEAAHQYRAFLGNVFTRVCESPVLFDVPARIPELELQSYWFSGAFGRDFHSTCGKKVRVVQFGHWNHGAGPDFTETAVEIDGECHAGAIELDPEPQDWENHGHGSNSEFNQVVLHVFPGNSTPSGGRFFTKTESHRNVIQVELNLDVLTDQAPRHLPEAHLGRCSFPLQEMDTKRIESLLEGAAQFRLEQKAQRLLANASLHTREEAVFQGMAEALGYRPNKLPMRVLAQRFPVRELMRFSPEACEARLFGAAGFLAPFDEADADAKTYLRELWDHWWKVRDTLSSLPNLEWKLAGNRPTNHPHRRLGALSELAANWKNFIRLVPTPEIDPIPSWPKRAREFLGNLEHSYWSHHYTLKSKLVEKQMALIGKDRITDIFGNILYPLAVSAHSGQWYDYADLPGSVENEKLRRATLRLFGEHPEQAKFSKRFYHQQALLQIFEDFCLQDVSECEDCPFPEQLGQW